VQFVEENYRNAPTPVSEFTDCEMEIDTERVIYAYREYTQNIERYSLLLESSNPDHYKRCGALLHALYGSRIIKSVTPVYNQSDIDHGVSLIHPHDRDKAFSALEFYEEHYNYIHAFDLSHRVCAAYESEPVWYDVDYLHNICFFMNSHEGMVVDTFFMIFKSLMTRGPSLPSL
jgi:hypothetical protein